MQSFIALAGLLFLLSGNGSAQAGDLTVSAASSLTNAFRQAGQTFEAQRPGTRVLFNFAASDALVQQIAKGAPVDVLAAADREAMDKAQQQGLLLTGSRRNFAANTLVLVVPADSSLALKSLQDLRAPAVRRIALGNPATAPFGRYARAALDAHKLWPALEGKAIHAQNVRQALDYVARGEVDAGFVYATDAAIQKDKVKIAFAVTVDSPIVYPVAVVKDSAAADEARRFIEFLLSPAGQTILAGHGFLRP